MKEYTNEEKDKLLLYHKFEKLTGYFVKTPPATEEYEYTYVSIEDFEAAQREGVKDYYSFHVEGPYQDLSSAFDDLANDPEGYGAEFELIDEADIERYFDEILEKEAKK